MSYCNQCGQKVEENAKFCANCGAPVNATPINGQQVTVTEQKVQQNNANEQAHLQVQPRGQANGKGSAADLTSCFDAEDIEQNKGMAILAYLSFLALIPLLTNKESKYLRFHTNQGLLLCISEVIFIIGYYILVVLSMGISFQFMLFVSSLWFVGLIFPVLSIIGIINVANGKAKEVPIVGKYRLLK